MKKSSIYLFIGPDTYRSLKKLQEWKEAFAAKYGQGSVREISLEQGVSLSELAGEASLFNPTTLTVVRNPFSSENGDPVEADDFLNLCKTGLPAGKHLLLWQGGALDKRTTLSRRVNQLGKTGKIQLQEFNFMEETDAIKFIAGELKKRDLKIKKDAADLLFKFCANEQGLLDSGRAINALEQLSAYCAAAKVVEAEDVIAVVPPFDPTDAFLPMLRSFARQDVPGFIKNLDRVIADSEAEAQLLGVVSALFDQIKNMLAVLELSEKYSLEQIDKKLSFKPGRSRYVLADARKFGRENLDMLLAKLLRIEYNVKKGNTVLASELSNLFVGIEK